MIDKATRQRKAAAIRSYHGTGEQAIHWVIHINCEGQEREFLDAWEQGDLEAWPEFYRWLDKQ